MKTKRKVGYEWVIKTLERDNYSCRDCGKKENKNTMIIVHHIDNSRKYGTDLMNNNLSNLISLCRQCHSKRHEITSDRYDVIELRTSGLTFEEIGEKLGFSRQRAYQLYRKNGGKKGTMYILRPIVQSSY